MALFGAFGSIGMLLFVDFSGTRRMRLLAYLATVLVGCLTISLGTLCCHETWLAVVVMALVGFGILFAGVIDGYIAAASLVLILTFVIAAMVEASASEIPDRLAGWGLAALFSLIAIFIIWPTRPPDGLRRGGAAALDALAALLDGMASTLAVGLAGEEEEERLGALSAEAYEKVVASRNAFVSLPHRPSGAGGRTAAFGRLVDDLDWFDALAREQPAPGWVSEGFAAERAAVETAVPAALRQAAGRLRANDPGDGGVELERLSKDHRAIGRAFIARLGRHMPEDDAQRVTEELNEAYRLRSLAYGALQIGRHAIQASGGEGPPEPTLTPTRSGLREGRRIAGSHAGFRSVWFRNSLRGAIGLALAVLVAKVTDAQNGFWVVLGTISVLRSSALATGTTVVEAITGTGIGIIVGGLLVWAIGDHTWLLWTVFPLAVLLGRLLAAGDLLHRRPGRLHDRHRHPLQPAEPDRLVGRADPDRGHRDRLRDQPRHRLPLLAARRRRRAAGVDRGGLRDGGALPRRDDRDDARGARRRIRSSRSRSKRPKRRCGWTRR